MGDAGGPQWFGISIHCQYEYFWLCLLVRKSRHYASEVIIVKEVSDTCHCIRVYFSITVSCNLMTQTDICLVFVMLTFSAHGTFIGTIRLEPHKPTQVQVDSVIRFGASTRSYVLREKPTMPNTALKSENVSENMQLDDEEGSKGGLLGLPESDTELDVSSDFLMLHSLT